MKRIVLLTSFFFLVVLLVGGVYAYQDRAGINSSEVDRTAAEQAVESGDYVAWKALHKNSNGKMSSLITEDNFWILKQIHEAKEAGDFETVRALKSEIGFNTGNGKGLGKGHSKGNCNNLA